MPGGRCKVDGVRAVLLTLAGVVLAASTATPLHAAEGSDAAQALAARYAPIVALKELEEGVPPCEGDSPARGEHFRPVPVEAVLGNEEVTLRGPTESEPYAVVKRAPTADDLVGKGLDFWLDFPGDALSPGCDYVAFEQRATAGRRPPVAYVRIATQPDRPGKLALQYWFYYLFNDYNNKTRVGLGDDPARFRRRQRRAGATRRADRGRLLPARGRGAGGLGRRQAGAGGSPAGRVSRSRLARKLLRQQPLARTQRRGGHRLRRHDLTLAPDPDDADPAAGCAGRSRRRVRVARLHRPLGREAEELQPGSHRPEREEPVDGADHLV